MVTSVQIAEKLKIETATVNYYARKLKIEPKNAIINNRTTRVFTEEEAEAVEAAYFKKAPASKKLTIEEMRALHPLVKDDRFFIEWFFPEDVEISEEL